VTILEARERLLPGEEPPIGELMAETLRAEGIEVRCAAEAREVGVEGRPPYGAPLRRGGAFTRASSWWR
jgi:hypothetical protein